MLSHVPTRMPLNNAWIRSAFGLWLHDRGRVDGYRHAGIDLYSHDTRVFSPVAGVITTATREGNAWKGYGPYIVEIRDHRGYHHLLAHLSNIDGSIQVGSAILPGSRVGSIRPGGHVHYEIRLGRIRSANPWQQTINPLDFHNIDSPLRFPYHVTSTIDDRGVNKMLVRDAINPALRSASERVHQREQEQQQQSDQMVKMAWLAGLAIVGWIILK